MGFFAQKCSPGSCHNFKITSYMQKKFGPNAFGRPRPTGAMMVLRSSRSTSRRSTFQRPTSNSCAYRLHTLIRAGSGITKLESSEEDLCDGMTPEQEKSRGGTIKCGRRFMSSKASATFDLPGVRSKYVLAGYHLVLFVPAIIAKLSRLPPKKTTE